MTTKTMKPLVIKKVTKPYHGMWCERRGTEWVTQLQTSDVGTRFVMSHWTDDREGEVRLVRGDGRLTTFRVYAQRVFAGVNLPEFRTLAEAWATELLAAINAGDDTYGVPR